MEIADLEKLGFKKHISPMGKETYKILIGKVIEIDPSSYQDLKALVQFQFELRMKDLERDIKYMREKIAQI